MVQQQDNWLEESERYLLGTTVTWAKVEEKLKKALQVKHANFGLKKKAESIGTGQGFMSTIARLSPDWTDSADELPKTFILKIPSEVDVQKYIESAKIDEKIFKPGELDKEQLMEARRSTMTKVHNTETGFYKFAEGKGLKIPKAYVMESVKDAGKEAVLIMEDLREEHIIPIFENISIDECTQVLEALAKAHAISLNDDSWIELQETSLKEMIETSSQTSDAVFKTTKLVEEIDPGRIRPYMKKLEKIFKEVFDLDLADNVYKEMGLPPVIVHGDMWSSNVLWKFKGSKRELAAIIDWQLIHPGCAAEDLARFICSSLSGADRRKNWELLLQRYYVSLEEHLGEKPPFSFLQLRKSFIRFLPCHLVLILPTLGPLVLEKVKRTMPNKYEKIKKAVADKAVAALEDVFSLRETGRMKSD